MEYYIRFYDHWGVSPNSIQNVTVYEDELQACAEWLHDREWNIFTNAPQFDVPAWIQALKQQGYRNCHTVTYQDFRRFVDNLRMSNRIEKVL